MAIRDLHDGAGTIITGLHERLAVVPAAPERRLRLRAAFAGHPEVRFVDLSSTGPALGGGGQPGGPLAPPPPADGGAQHAQTLAGLEGRVAGYRKARDEAGEALVDAVAGVEAALGALDDFDQAEREMERALLLRDRATAAEALEARRLAEVLERRLRLTEQRQDAVRVIEQVEAGGPVRRSAELRRQIADMEAGLARAEAEQIRAERAAEATLHQAREARLASAADLERADRVLRADLPGVAGVSAHEWPPGPPLPVLVAERRDRITAVLAERYQARTAAKAAMDQASGGLRAAERDLAEARRNSASFGAASQLEHHLAAIAERSGGVVVCDGPFGSIDTAVVTAVLEHVVRTRDVQVVILTEDAELLDWARSLDPEVGRIIAATEADGPAAAGDQPRSATITPLRPPPSEPGPASPPLGAGPADGPAPMRLPRPSPAAVPSHHVPPGPLGLRAPADLPASSVSLKETLRHVSTYP